ncbi:MAG TPA: universal stress protein [Pelomicrobium sp.]|nr:universal stress protein [Pelomicrobium sp.]
MTPQLSPLGRFERVLLITDGEEFSAGAERVALALARRCGATLYAAMPVLTNPEYEALAPAAVGENEAAAAAALERVARAAAAQDVRCETRVLRGEEPYEDVVAEAHARRADLIVIRRRGRKSFLGSLLVGETVTRVLGHAPCAVLTVPRAAESPSRGIVVGVDGSASADAAAVAAAALARHCALPLTVVAVHDTADQRSEAAQTLDRVAGLLAAEGTDAARRLQAGKPYQGLIDAAADTGADLIVLGSHGRSGLRHAVIGSTVEQVIGRAACAVLVVKAY